MMFNHSYKSLARARARRSHTLSKREGLESGNTNQIAE